tara:strand:- start:803 stop:1378 length:576 start_codon:yes stop_codon:yes gene_type:complete
MPIAINGSGTVTGISVGGLPDGIVDRDTLAAEAKGSILQVKQTIKTDTTSTTSLNTFVDISGMSVSITPSSSSNKILVMVDMRLSANQNRNVAYRLMRDSTAIYVGDSAGSRTQGTGSMRLMSEARYDMQSETAIFLDSPSTTSATTYKVQWCHTFGGSGDNCWLNRSYEDNDNDDRVRGASSITVQEVAA